MNIIELNGNDEVNADKRTLAHSREMLMDFPTQLGWEFYYRLQTFSMLRT